MHTTFLYCPPQPRYSTASYNLPLGSCMVPSRGPITDPAAIPCFHDFQTLRRCYADADGFSGNQVNKAIGYQIQQIAQHIRESLSSLSSSH
jgi:hypothetical protein